MDQQRRRRTVRSIAFDPKALRQMDAIAAKLACSRSRMMREAVKLYVREFHTKRRRSA